MAYLLKSNYPYVSEQGADYVRNFKYKGGDNSILCYKYFYRPLAQFMVNYTPLWLA